MLDPLILRIISVGFALLFIFAAAHKFNNKLQFRGVLEAYKICPPGMLGLETAFALALGDSGLDLPEVLALLSWRPAAIAGVADRHGAPVVPGAPANLCVVDPDETWTVSGAAMASLSSNTPYEGRTMRGRVRHTIRAGVPVVVDGEARR